MDVRRCREQGFASLPASNQLVGKRTVLVEIGVRLGDDVVAFLNGRQILDLVGHAATLDLAVRRFEKAVFVQSRIERHRVDQADVRAFGRFDRADAAVVRGMHVAHFEARTLARQTARPEGRNTTLVRDLGQRVGLVHELRELARTEELLDGSRNWLGVDQVMRHQVFGFGLAKTLLDRALNSHETGAELVFRQFADATHTTVAEVVDIVDLAVAVTQLDQDLDGLEDVFVGQRHRAGDVITTAKTAVDLHAADA